MKKPKEEIFKWRNETFSDPYKVIEAIFDFTDVYFYKNFIRDIVLYSGRKKKYKKGPVGNVMWKLEGISCLLDACFVISKEKKHGLLDILDDDVMNEKFYSKHEDKNHIWSDFPRLLSAKEFINPYKALKKIFRRTKPESYHESFKELMGYAYGSYTDRSSRNIMKIYFQLTKLFEIAHLIYIREIVHIRNWRKP